MDGGGNLSLHLGNVLKLNVILQVNKNVHVFFLIVFFSEKKRKKSIRKTKGKQTGR